MSNKYKGLIITFEKEVSEERVEEYEKIFKSIRNVLEIKPLIKGLEDCMSENKGRIDFRNEILNFIIDDVKKNGGLSNE